MSQLTTQRQKRKIRRIVGFSIFGVLILTGILYWFFREEPPIEVRTGNLFYGDISSTMMLSAEIVPGSVEQLSPEQVQRVVDVRVKKGGMVKAGDTLLLLDQSELEDQYEQAKLARLELEKTMAQTEETARIQEQAIKDQAYAAEKAAQDLNRQISALSSSLSASLSRMVQLAGIQPGYVEISSDLSSELEVLLQDFDPDGEDAAVILQQAVELVSTNVLYSTNPEYTAMLDQLQIDVANLGNLSGQVLGALAGSTGSLSSNLTSGLVADFSSQLGGQLGSIGTSLESALKQAKQTELTAEENFANSSQELKATTSGVIAQINVVPGSYTGSSSNTASMPSFSSLDLSALISGSGGSLAALPSASAISTSGQPAIVIYDTTRPKAIYRASQFDSGRLKVNMPVKYQYDQLNFSGKITYIAPFANSGSFSGDNSSLPSGLSSLGDFSSEPWLEVEMSINGQNLSSLIPGFFIDAEIETASAQNVLILPAEAMRRELSSYYVYTVSADNVLEQKIFTPGIQSDMTIQVLEGLSIEDVVVLNPDSSLVPGTTVSINNRDS